MNPLSVRVPGSTSNCGAGFDTLGLGLQIYNTVEMRFQEDGKIVPRHKSDGRALAMVAEAAAAFAERAGSVQRGFDYRITGDVPPARGLGSSVTILAGVVAGLNRWAGEVLSRDELVALITKLEGHPDNAMAGVLGGFCVGRCGATAADYRGLIRVEVPDSIQFVVVSPDVEVATKVSRGVLPAQVSHADAVRSVNSAAYLTAAFVAGDFAKLRGATSDFLHEPYRLPGIKGARASIDAGVAAGALTGWLSGSGSSVLCVVDGNAAPAVAAAMSSAFSDVGIASEARILLADNCGLVIQG
jgi:homoserine kinase